MLSKPLHQHLLYRTSLGSPARGYALYDCDARVHDDPIAANLAHPEGSETRHCSWTRQITQADVSKGLQIIDATNRGTDPVHVAVWFLADVIQLLQNQTSI